MRVPVPVAATLAVAVVAAVWWFGTRHLDFLKNKGVPVVAQAAGASSPAPAGETGPARPPAVPEGEAETVPGLAAEPAAEPAPEPVEEPLPDVGDLAASPALDTYADLAGRGPATLARLAQALETEGHPQHALLAWERILDHTLPPPELRATAGAAVARLRPALPPWNVDPMGRTRLLLRVEAHGSLREPLAPAVAEAAVLLGEASSGLLEITPELVTGKSREVAALALPVAVSIHAPAPAARGTPVLTFAAVDKSAAGLRAGLARTLYRLVRDWLQGQQGLSPLPEPDADADPVALLRLGPTRLAWDRFAVSFTRP